MPDTAELFRHDVPVLRTSLARHGLVDVSTSPTARILSIGPPSSEDLSAADRGEEQWGAAAGAIGGAESAGAGAGAGAGFQALVGVDSVVVGHVRAAEELRATLLYAPAPKNSLKAQELVTTKTTPRDDRSKISTQTHRGQRLRERHSSGSGSGSGSSGNFSSPLPSASFRRQRAGSTASLAAASAMAAVRKGDRPFYLGAAQPASRGGGVRLDQAPQPTSGVSMANLLDIAVSLFGGASSGGTKANSNTNSISNGADGRRHTGEKLVTFTVDVHTGSSTTLGVTVKELGGGAVFVEDVRKLAKGCSGPAELAGILVGDVILGINYKPLEKGLVHTATLLAEAISLAGFVKLQISRPVRSNGWRPSLPGKDCPIVTELMWRIAQLRKSGILNSAERHAITELVLQRMAWEEGTLAGPPRAQAPFSSPAALPLDSASDVLDASVLRVKGLREAVSVRCLFAKSTIETVEVSSVWGPPSAEEASSSSSSSSATTTAAAAPAASTAPGTLVTVRYVLRAEDIGTGREWLVFPQYRDFSELRQQLLLMWPPIADLPFPAKRPVPRVVAHATGSTAEAAERAREAVLEDGVVRLEAFLEGAMALPGIYVSIDPRCSGVLRLIQDFLGRPKDLLADEIALTPACCDQKRAELLLYRLFNQVDSPAARFKILLMRDFENEVSRAPDMQSLMRGASSRLRRLQDFVLEQHEEQLSSASYATGEEKEATMRKAVRRQVELSFYLPLRRCLWKELTRRLRGPARKLSRAIKILRCSSPSVFGVESTEIFDSKEWGPAKESMGHATRRVLPTDQIDGLRRAAEHIAALHASLQQTARDVSDHHDHHHGVSEGNARSGIMSGDAERASDVHNQSESEGESEGEQEDGRGVMVCVEDGDRPDATCTDGPLSTGEGASGRRERDSNDRLLVTTEISTGPTTATNGTREMCENDTRGTGDGGGEVTDATASDSREPNCNLVVPSAEGEHEQIAEDGDDDGDDGDDGIGGPETTALAARSLHFDDDSRRRAELSRNGQVAGTGGEASLRCEPNGNGSPGHNWRASASASASPEKEKFSSSETSPASSADSTGTVAIGHDREQDGGDEVGDEVAAAVRTGSEEAMGADDFLPLFALVLVHSAPLDLLLPQTLLTHLMDADGSLSEAGYLVATLEAAVSFIAQVYASTCCPDDKREIEIYL